jgi:formylglycine-generating enzyme required for sulfatase activity
MNDSDDENLHMARGGAWIFDPVFSRSSLRGSFSNGESDPSLGFRVVLVPS